MGLGLFQVGEFSFLLAREGVSTDAISQETYSLVLATAAVTMALTPLAARLAPVLYGRYRRRFPREPLQTFNLPAGGLRDHAVVAGYGRVGSFVARLDRLGKPFVIVEANPNRADQAKAAGFPTVYGDAVAIPVLEAAGISSARLVVLTIPDALAARLAVERLRGLAPKPISWYGPRAPGNSKTSAAWASTRRCSRSWRPAWSWRARPSPASGSQRKKPRPSPTA